MVIRHRIMNVWSRANFKDYFLQPSHCIKEKTKGLQGPAQSYKAGVWIWVTWLPRYVPFLVPSKLVKYSRVARPLARVVLVPSSPSCPTSSSLNAWPSWSLPTGGQHSWLQAGRTVGGGDLTSAECQLSLSSWGCSLLAFRKAGCSLTSYLKWVPFWAP